MDNLLKGTGVALVTPFDKNYQVDYYALEKVTDYVINKGVDYLVVQGTTGESVTVQENEKKKILTLVYENRKDKPVVLGIGGNDTQKVILQFDLYDQDQYDAVLSVCPYYNKPTQQGMINHFSRIADRSPKPVILYNVPGRTGINLAASATIELSKHPNIIGIKEASGDFAQCISIIKNTDPDFLLISGDDLLALPLIAVGAKGVISVIANALPKEMSSIVKNGLEGQYEPAMQYLHKISEICGLMFKEGNPAGVKGLMEIIGLCARQVRPPLMDASKNLMIELRSSLNQLQ